MAGDLVLSVGVASCCGWVQLVPLWSKGGGQCGDRRFCAPDVKVEPRLTLENLFGVARVEEPQNGTVMAQKWRKREPVLELALVVGIPIEVPRVEFTFETIFGPFGTIGAPVHRGTAAEGGGLPFKGITAIEAEFELNLSLLEPEQVGGWIESHLDDAGPWSLSLLAVIPPAPLMP